MFIFRKKRKPLGRFNAPIYHKNRGFRYFNKKRSPLYSKIIPGLLIFLIFINLLLFSGIFEIKNVSVINNINIKQEDLINSTKEILSAKLFGIIPLNNYLLANENDIRSSLLNKYPIIESLDIKKKPFSDLIIKTKEKDSRIIWCKLGSCYYLDSGSIAFANANEELILKDKPLKIYEQPVIEEESEDNYSEKNNKELDELEIPLTDASYDHKEPGDATEKIGTAPEKTIELNDRVADEYFIRFLDEIDKLIASKTRLNIKYYKTKGAGTREVIAYTDKNTRLYFDSAAKASSQADYLAYFLNEGIAEDKINDLKYIYLKSDNKIFYR